MGGSLQPFFAERNLEANAAMSRNTYRAPANALVEGGRTDTALALSMAMLEEQQERRRQQEAQRLGYQQQPIESQADAERRLAYQTARRAPSVQGQSNRSSQYGMSGGAPASDAPLSVPKQSSTIARPPSSTQPRRSDNAHMQVNDIGNGTQPVPGQDQHLKTGHRRSGSSGLPQSNGGLQGPQAADPVRHQRSMSHDAAMPDPQARSVGPTTFLESHKRMLEAQKHRAMTCDAHPASIRTDNRVTMDAVAHVTAGLPLPASPLAGGGEPTTTQPTQSWITGSGSHWDSEIARQMSGQQLQPLTPRVNSPEAVAQPESAATSRARLEQRLKMYGLCERKIKGDGACQFRSISDQLYRTQDYHAEVRRVAVHQLRSNFAKYSQFVPSDYWKYVYDMEQPETWGDHICLQAIADAYGLRMNIITSYPDANACFIGITPEVQKTHRILYLSFWAEIHYQSIYPVSDPPASEKFLGSKTLARWLA